MRIPFDVELKLYLTYTPMGYIMSKEVRLMDMNERCCHECKRTKERGEDEKKSLMHRLSRIEGQIRGIKSMIERDEYCIDILTQSSAVSAALGAFNRELLSSHIKTCVKADIKAGNDETLDELLGMLQKLMK